MSLISSLDAIDPEQMLFSCMVCGRTTGEYELKMVYRDHDVRPVFDVVRTLKNLCLSDQEMAVVLPYTFFDACEYSFPL